MAVESRIRPVTRTELASLPSCLGVCPNRELTEDADWATATEEALGWCGVKICRDGDTIGYLLVAAPGTAPLRGALINVPVSRDAAVLIKVWVSPDHRHAGVGRQLVQAAAAAARRRHVVALEAVASNDLVAMGRCAVPPLPWLLRAGFTVTRQHPLHPRVRLELDRTVSVPLWAPLVERLRGLIRRPQSPPQPTTRDAELSHAT